MGKPLPTLTIPAATTSGAKTLSYKQLRALWIQAGGNPALASTMAAVALAESHGRIDALNDTPSTGDYSVGPWQINYFGGMREGRTKQFGAPEKLRSDPLANARAAVALAGDGSGFSNWTTYTSGAYKAFLTPQTSAEKAAQAAADAAAKANSQPYVQATTDLSVVTSQARAAAKATAHISDPWVTVTKDRKGNVTGFGTSTGASAPATALTYGGQPVTQNQAFGPGGIWGSNYDNIFEGYTGRKATPAEQAKLIEQGLSQYELKNQLSKQAGFASSPIYKAQGAGVVGYSKDVIGGAPPADFVRQAVAEGWDQQTLHEKLRQLPAYRNGPEFKNAKASIDTVYRKIYGNPQDGPAGKEANAWIDNAALNGWTQEAAAQALRSNAAYQYSPEYEAKATGFLDAMGLFIGARPVLKPTKAPTTTGLQAPLPLEPSIAKNPGLLA